MKPKLINVKKKPLNSYVVAYDLEYQNKKADKKVYSIISRNELTTETVGVLVNNAVTAFVLNPDRTKALLLNEFRMGVNDYLYNTVSGLIDAGETAEEAMERELMEETGLTIEHIIQEFPPSYSSIGISDETVTPFILTVNEDEFKQSLEDNEDITPVWMTKSEVAALLETSKLGARTQLFGYMFVNGQFDKGDVK